MAAMAYSYATPVPHVRTLNEMTDGATSSSLMGHLFQLLSGHAFYRHILTNTTLTKTLNTNIILNIDN